MSAGSLFHTVAAATAKALVPIMDRLDTIPACDRQIDRHRTTSERRAVETNLVMSKASEKFPGEHQV